MNRTWLYRAIACIAAVLVFAGFRAFYLRHAAPSWLFVVHGVVFTAWIVVFLAQTVLVAAGRVDVHRRLGMAGAGIAAAMLVLGPMVAITAARHGMPLDFLATPLTDILVFAVFVATALWWRRRPETHKRLMALATIAILPPAIARLPSDFFAGPVEVFSAADVVLVIAIAWDTIRSRRLHPAFAWGGAVLVASQPLRVAFAGTDTWMAVARWLVA